MDCTKDSIRPQLPLVSIIIPVYKVEKYIDQCVKSILAQTYTNFEVILVDDGSPDKCPQICDGYCSLDQRIRVIHKENGGASSARNEGIRNAIGEYILFVDGDDYWDDESALSIMACKIDKLKADVVVFGYKKLMESRGDVINTLSEINISSDSTQNEILNSLITSGVYCSSPCNKLISRQLLMDNNIFFREGVTSEDIEWSCLLALKLKIISYSDVCPYVYRQHSDSVTASMRKDSIIQLRNNIIQSIEQCNICEKQKNPNVNAAKAYIAYQYATIFFAAHNVKHENMYEVIEPLKKYTTILEYSNNKRIAFVRKMLKIFGFHNLFRLTGVYWRLRY